MKIKNKKIIIAIDGYSGCGKSSTAKLLAKELDYKYLDSGSMYRAVTLFAIDNGFFNFNDFNFEQFKNILRRVKFDFKDKYNSLLFNKEVLSKNIRSHEVSEKVSQIAKIPFVRLFVLNQLRSLILPKGLIIEGRDIGTVVFPNADYKFFFTGSIDLRAERRWNEMKEKGIKISKEEVRKNLDLRDKTDVERNISPLMKADDAIEVDVSSLNVEEVFKKLLYHINIK